MKGLKSKLNYKRTLALGLLFCTACNTQKSIHLIEKQPKVKDSIPVVAEKEIVTPIKETSSKTLDAIKDIYGFDLQFLTKSYLAKLDVQNENDFLILYQHLDGLKTSFNEEKSVDFDKYYLRLVNDTTINSKLAPINFSCIEECTSPYAGIDTKELMQIAKNSNLKKAQEFTLALNYAYSGIENEYVSFLEYCDECFGATSNIGDDRIYKFLKLNEPFLNDHTILGDRLSQITEESLKLAIGETYRFSSEEVLLELQKWIDEKLIPENQLDLVLNKIEEIKNNSEKNQFNYVSESYPEMHN